MNKQNTIYLVCVVQNTNDGYYDAEILTPLFWVASKAAAQTHCVRYRKMIAKIEKDSNIVSQNDPRKWRHGTPDEVMGDVEFREKHVRMLFPELADLYQGGLHGCLGFRVVEVSPGEE